ncbi:GNAT family N-acetyltransferase [Chloroflexi bacterium TSY]|nr:GNAT family N-acetyltransferase [Chloroflexi bacterium TSY]
MNITIRTATPTDYAKIVDIGWSATSDYGLTVKDLIYADQQRAPTTVAVRLIAMTPEQEIVGTASYAQSAPDTEPQKFNVWFHVLPRFQGQGIGKLLYENVMYGLASHAPDYLETGVRPDLPRAVRFLADRGFVEVSRECETHLDLTTFDPTRFAADVQRVESRGIVLKTLTELADDPARDAKLYELYLRKRDADMEPMEFASFDEWKSWFWQLPHVHPDGSCMAVTEGEYIGQSHAMPSDSSELAYGYTGVLPAYRNQGVAKGMKLRVLQWAKEQGYTLVRSWSDSRNEGMIRVNLYLGFKIQPPVLWMKKDLNIRPIRTN